MWALHGWQQPGVCAGEFAGDTGWLHVAPGTHSDNMMMDRTGRGGGRVAVRGGDNGCEGPAGPGGGVA